EGAWSTGSREGEACPSAARASARPAEPCGSAWERAPRGASPPRIRPPSYSARDSLGDGPLQESDHRNVSSLDGVITAPSRSAAAGSLAGPAIVGGNTA